MYERFTHRTTALRAPKNTYQEVQPFPISWGGREFTIQKVGDVRQYTEGKSIIRAFRATDGVNYFELRCEADELIAPFNLAIEAIQEFIEDNPHTMIEDIILCAFNEEDDLLIKAALQSYGT
ncbi:MAG TPA: hypothetical protein VNI82_00550 [Candidatus Nitrosotenuis sp.]|nr:hypothetical protein [Candidatus Nitrosotenuis sp.]